MAEAAEEIIRETCKELDIQIIDMAVNIDHVHLFIKYPPKYSVSWIAKRIKGRSSKLLRDRFPQLKEWCAGHLWAPSCYHKSFIKSFIKNASQSVGHGWEVVGRYISGQKGLEKKDVLRGERYSYEKADTVPVVLVDEEKKKVHKIWYVTLYNKLFGGKHQK